MQSTNEHRKIGRYAKASYLHCAEKSLRLLGEVEDVLLELLLHPILRLGFI